MNHTRPIVAIGLLFLACSARAQLPAPPSPQNLADWSNPFDADCPGLLAADSLFDKPAGVHGPVVVRDGHFYSGDQRVRFWGMNLAFGANFPTHADADAVARRLSRFGINAVRLHHMDNQPFPNGIFADKTLTTLSPEALDRLDYFTAALKARGIWSDINLHVSRDYSRYHPESSDGPVGAISKIVDLFDPALIRAQKQYAHDLLTHVNAYTHHRYADEPAVAIVEINNENSLFMWDAKEKLAALPPVYDRELRGQWCRWLLDKYKTRDGLKSAWAVGSAPLGKQMLIDPGFASTETGWTAPWRIEADNGTKAAVTHEGDATVLNVASVDDTPWHVQWGQTGLAVKEGAPYTVSFRARADHPVKIDVLVGQAHAPWESLGLTSTIDLTTTEQTFTLTFAASQSDDHARISFTMGHALAVIHLARPLLAPGGVEGLRASEMPQNGTVAMPGPAQSGTRRRLADWYQFLEETEARYYQSMFSYLRRDLGVKCPVTGTTSFGLLPLKAQLGMDFIDAHAYWDHPQFPHRPWDASDWLIKNKPMVDSPGQNALFALAGNRVAGKPFTVTEYNHAAPNEWQAECVPMIASYAAAQDWDGVFLFAYSHSSEFEKPLMQDFFNFEGNPMKMPLVAMGARIFLGQAVLPLRIARPREIDPDPAAGAGQSNADASSLSQRVSISYAHGLSTPATFASTPRLAWTSTGPGTGRYTMADPHAAVFVGFAAGATPVDLGEMTIQSMRSPFATLMLTAADGRQPIASADRLILTTVARAQNTNEQWNADRTSVGKRWGHAPEQIEEVVATIRLKGAWAHAYALDAAGKPTAIDVAKRVGDDTNLEIGSTAAQAYVIDRH